MNRFLLICLLSLPFSLFAQTYEVDILFSGSEELKKLSSVGIPTDDGVLQKSPSGYKIRAFLNPKEFESLERSGVQYSLISDNWEKKYSENLKADKNRLAKAADSSRVKSFRLGSMGGYLTLDQVTALLDSMAEANPQILSAKISIGKSHEGRDLWMWKLSDNPTSDESEPEVLFTGLHHAREGQGMTSALYFVLYLIENYGKESQTTFLVDNREIYFVPVVNPDGYVFNESTNPDGGGMWRKNRRLNEDFSYGVDLNRNYGFGWGHDDEGSSPDPSTNVYRGAEPFSEKETQVMRDFCNSRQFKVALNYHSYGNLLMYPWGYLNSTLTPDSVQFTQMATEMTRLNQFTIGTGDQALGYKTNGDADDWMYGEQTSKPKIIAMTPEIGTNDDGFWPLPSRILPLAESCMEMNFRCVWMAGGYPVLESTTILDESGDGYFSAGEKVTAEFSFKNLGNEQLGSSSYKHGVMFSNLGTFIMFPIPLDPIEPQKKTLIPITFSLPDTLSTGSFFYVYLDFENSGSHFSFKSDTLFSGIPVLVFSDSFDSTLNKWTISGGWKQVTNEAVSLPSSLHESPDGNYPNKVEYSIKTKNSILLPVKRQQTFIQFKTRWDIERDYDKGQVLISGDGENWIPARGKLTSPGSGIGLQVLNEPVYDGIQNEWVAEQINLANWKHSSLFIQFLFKSDGFTTGDGWYIDDLKVLSYEGKNPTHVENFNQKENSFVVYPAYPNPFNPETQISFNLPKPGEVNFSLFDSQGKKVMEINKKNYPAGFNTFAINGSNLSTGVYFFQLRFESSFKSGKITLIK
ncbi:MAG: T9SS type A sorting domain-containing protein [Bacteroidetes bacterium]|nr:T9SS type A sorting domain-containing protein [Bacteroidota bacterium]